MKILIEKTHQFLELFSILKKKNPKCHDCGYVFNNNKTLTICNNCNSKGKFYNASKGRKKKWVERYSKNPNKCPECKSRLSSQREIPKGGICPKCSQTVIY